MAKSLRTITWGTAGKQSLANDGDGTLFYSAFDASGAALIARTNIGIQAVGLYSYRITPIGWQTTWNGYERFDDGVNEEVSSFEADTVLSAGNTTDEIVDITESVIRES